MRAAAVVAKKACYFHALGRVLERWHVYGNLMISNFVINCLWSWLLTQGGSESWFTDSNNAIASLAFHPTAQLLLIATANEIHFWDWSRREPFAVVKTASEMERVRWVPVSGGREHLYVKDGQIWGMWGVLLGCCILWTEAAERSIECSSLTQLVEKQFCGQEKK